MGNTSEIEQRGEKVGGWGVVGSYGIGLGCCRACGESTMRLCGSEGMEWNGAAVLKVVRI